VGCLKGIGEAARALDFPIVSGNVSLYNETQGAGILPTPAIGGVGVIADVETATLTGFTKADQAVLLIGVTQVGWDNPPMRGIFVASKTARRRLSI